MGFFVLSPKEAFEFTEILAKGHGRMLGEYDGHSGGPQAVGSTFILRRPFCSVTQIKTLGLTPDFVSETSYCYKYNSYIRDFPYKGTFPSLEFYFIDGASFEEFLTNPLNVPFFDIANAVNTDFIRYLSTHPIYTDGQILNPTQTEICEEIWERYHS